MPDAMFLIFTVLVMYIIINECEEQIMLIMIGILFLLVSIDVLNQVSLGYYDKLFTASIPTNGLSITKDGIGWIFGTIPLFAFIKVIIRRMQDRAEYKKQQIMITEE